MPDYQEIRNNISANANYTQEQKSELLRRVDEYENSEAPISLKKDLDLTPPKIVEPIPYSEGSGGAPNYSTPQNTTNEGTNGQPTQVYTTEPQINENKSNIQVDPQQNQTQLQTSKPTTAPGNISGIPSAQNPIGIINQYQNQLFTDKPAIEGNSNNLLPEEQAKLEKIDMAEQNGTIPRETAAKMRDAVRLSAIKRTSVAAQPSLYTREASNIDKKFKTDQEFFENQSKTYTQANTDIASLEAKQNALNIEHQEKMKKLDDDINNFVKIQPTYKEDTYRFYNSKSTGQKVGFGIFSFLEALAAGWNKKEPTSMKWLNEQIDKDIAAQRATYEAAAKKWGNEYASKISGYGRALDIMKSEDGAASLLRLQKLDKMNRDLNILTSTTNSEKAKLAGENAKIELDKEKAAIQNKLEMQKYGIIAGSKGNEKPKTRREVESEVNGLWGKAKDLKLFEDIELSDSIDQLMALSKNGEIPGVTYGKGYQGGTFLGYPLGSPQAQKAKIIYNNMRNGLIHALAGSAASESEIERISGSVPENPTYDQVKAMKEYVENKINNNYKTVTSGSSPEAAATFDIKMKALKPKQPQKQDRK